MKKNFENTFLYQLYHRCDGISDKLVPVSSEVMRDFDSRYSGKIRVLVNKGLVGGNKSYSPGHCSKKYCLTDLGCQVASEIDYESIKDSIDKWDRLLNAQAEKSSIKKQKKSSPTPTEEKEESSVPLSENQAVPSEPKHARLLEDTEEEPEKLPWQKVIDRIANENRERLPNGHERQLDLLRLIDDI